MKEGDTVKGDRAPASKCPSARVLGRVVDPLGRPMDGKGPINGESSARSTSSPRHRRAPARARAVQTGIKAIDSMIPIGGGA